VSSRETASESYTSDNTTDGESLPFSQAAVEQLDPQLTTIQPGGGVCMQIELAWGYVRRWLLKRLFPGYVARMQQLRLGSHNACPWEVLDPRDLKFYRNQDGYSWAETDDPFTWRDRLPLVRVGLAEAILISALLWGLAALAASFSIWSAIPFVAVALCILWFFRNPRRIAPAEPGLIVAPADGLVVSCTEVTDEFVGSRAMEIGIFLSVFDVHINRVPVAARIIGMTYRHGKYLNALLPESARENQQLAVRMEEAQAPYRRFVVRQIAGAIARRIVCHVKPGEELKRGAAFGMIKFGSRTELVLPFDPSLEVLVKPGDRVRAGTTIMARFRS
jgi:phosphatidylserine decarboxylase